MDEETLKSNLKTLKEMVLDERKLVTYISLSKELCIHVNEGKSMLSQIVRDIRKNHSDTSIFVSFIISGLLDNNSASTTVCPEPDMDSLRKTYKTIFYEHIYSVCHGLSTVDNVAFAAVNKFEDLPLCTGLIKGDSCIKRSQDEIGSLKSNSQSKIIEPKPSSIPEKSTKEKVKDVIKNGHEAVKNVHETKSEPIIKTEIPSPKKDTSKTSIKKNGKPVTKSIAGFFNKAPSAPNLKSTTKSPNSQKQVAVVKTKDKQDVKIKVETMDTGENKTVEVIKAETMDTDENGTAQVKETSTSSKLKSKDKAKSNSLTQMKKTAKVDKKRKRVLHVSDSESEDDANDPFTEEMVVDHESEDEIPATPTVNTVKITSGLVNPRKKRKIVDKTYTDEDGYILTKKEEVYESCSENEEEASSKENIEFVKENVVNVRANTEKVHATKSEVSPKGKGKGSKKKVSPPQKGKQASITNFFNKKV